MNHGFAAPWRATVGSVVAAIALAAVPASATAQDFDAVLAAPDDPDLNIAFGRDAIQRGELSIAASALERILINDPDRHAVRLFYAVVLYRLGDLQNAREQLRRLEAAPLTDAQRAERARYASLIEDLDRRFTLSGRVTAGVVYEQDAAGAYQTAFDLIGGPTDAEGLSSAVGVSVDGARTIGSSRDWQIFSTGDLHDQRALSGEAVDFQRADAEVGLRRSGRLSEAQIGLAAHHVRLEDEPQLTEAGVKARISYRVTNALTLRGRAEVMDQSYDEPVIDALAPVLGGDRSGTRSLVGVGARLDVTPRTTLDLEVDYSTKSAGYDPFGYDGWRVGAAVYRRFDRGVYALAAGSIRWLDYDGPDPFFLSGAVREDTRTTARVVLGVPLSAFEPDGLIGDFRDRLAFEVAATYASRESSGPLADYDGLGAELRLVWRFGSSR